MNKDEFNSKIRILLDISKQKGYVTYEEIDRIFSKDIDIEELENIFLVLQKKGVRIEDEKRGLPKLAKDYKQEIEHSISTYIDTPEKFYFVELHNIKKFDREKEKYYSRMLTDIKREINNIVVHTNYFIIRLLKEFYKIKRKKLGFDEIFDNASHLDKKEFENFQERIKQIYKKRIMLLYAKNNLKDKEFKLKNMERKIIEELGNAQIKFKYIIKCINEASQKKDEFDKIELERESIKTKYKLSDTEFDNILNDVKFNISANLELNAPVEKEIKNFLHKEKKIKNWFTRYKTSYDEIKKLTDRAKRLIEKYEYLKELIINPKLPIVIVIARYYSYRGLSFQDLIQEGNLGLLEAIEKYDYYRCKKEFSGYASWWIRKRMSDAIMKNNENLKLTKSLKKDIKQFLKAVNKLRGTLLRTPTDKEIADELEWNIDKVKEIIKYLKKPLSLDAETGNENTTLKDYLEDISGLTPAEMAINNIVKEKVKEIISKLTDIEQQVIKMRFGIEDYTNESFYYDEIAEILKIPVESVKEIEKKALKKLRYWGKKNNLDDFLD